MTQRIEKGTAMKLKGEFVLREVAGENILIPVGETALKFNGMITLDPVGAVIWSALGKRKGREEILQEILSRFDVEMQTALDDLDSFLEQLQKADLLER